MCLVKLSELRFCAGGDGLPLLGQGWSEPEAGYVWATGDFSGLSLPVAGSHPAYVVVLAVRPIEHWQRVAFWSGGTLLGLHLITQATRVSISVARGLVVEGRLDLVMTHCDRVRACELSGGGDDVRLLSVALSGAEVHGSTRVPAPGGGAGRRACRTRPCWGSSRAWATTASSAWCSAASAPTRCTCCASPASTCATCCSA